MLCIPPTIRFSSLPGSLRRAWPAVGSRGRSPAWAPGGRLGGAAGARGAECQVDAVGRVEGGRGAGAAAVDGVEAEGGRPLVEQGGRIDDGGQVVGTVVEREIVIDELADVGEAGVDGGVLFVVNLALGRW